MGAFLLVAETTVPWGWYWEGRGQNQWKLYDCSFLHERISKFKSVVKFIIGDQPLSCSIGFMLFLGIEYCRIISGKVVAWKYFLLGCSFVPCSLEYFSILLSWYVFLPNSSWTFSKNSPACFPISIIHTGGIPSISTILETWLYSELPGNSGSPKKSSTTIHPRDHMSIDDEYLKLHERFSS